MINIRWISMSALFVILTVIFSACTLSSEEPTVVIYTSVYQVYAEPILQQFEEQTGIRVLAVYDVEATKTTGLVNRLIAEQDRPHADVFWSGEFIQTLLLKDEGLLAPYNSPNNADLPAYFIDTDYYWTAFGGRARVILVNTDRVPLTEAPDGLADLLDLRWEPDRIGIANPLFGTTYTHAAAIYAAEGTNTAHQYFADLAERHVRVLDGNSVVRDLVAAGELDLGLTDTDDACGALANGANVAIIYPDQGEGEAGTLVIPNTVALIAGGPNPEEGQILIDYLLSIEVESTLVASGWFQIPSRNSGARPACPESLPHRVIELPLEDIYHALEPTKTDLTDLFMR